jgi:hypothetical protein
LWRGNDAKLTNQTATYEESQCELPWFRHSQPAVRCQAM